MNKNALRVTINDVIKLGRFPFLVGGFLLFCIGIFLALLSGASFTLNRFLLGYLVLFTAQLSLSYSNNYFDAETDQFNEITYVSGGSKLLLNNPELRIFCKQFAIALIILSVIFSITFSIVYAYGPFFVLYVIFGNLLAWFYSAPPLKLAYKGLGELANIIAYGILMPGIGFLTFMPTFNSLFFYFVPPLLLYGFVFIITVELPDIDGDSKGKKQTFLVRNGVMKGINVILISLILIPIYFFLVFNFYEIDTVIDFSIVGIITLVPLLSGIVGFLHRPSLNRHVLLRLTYINIAGIIFFMFGLNTYLLYLTLS